MHRSQVIEVLTKAVDPDSENHKRALNEALRLDREPLARLLFEHRLAEPVAEVLKQQAEFPEGGRFVIHRDNGWSSLDADSVAVALVKRVGAGEPPADAVSWLERVLPKERGEGLCVLAVWGVSVRDKISFDNGVELLPIEELPDSSLKAHAMRRRDFGDLVDLVPMPFLRAPEAALTYRLTLEPAVSDLGLGTPPIRKDQLREYELLTDVLLALTAVGPSAPLHAGYWFQYLDQDLHDALFHVGKTLSPPEILPTGFLEPKVLDPDATTQIVSQYLRLGSGLRRRVQVSLQRLNQAIRRSRFGDKAAELSIALEALLVDDPGENTHKVGLRASLLLGGTSEERIRHRAIIGGIYSARSALMHGGTESTEIKLKQVGKLPSSTVAEEGVVICAAVIRKILELGGIPSWYGFELGPGGG
jgi:hypothetical protein